MLIQLYDQWLSLWQYVSIATRMQAVHFACHDNEAILLHRDISVPQLY